MTAYLGATELVFPAGVSIGLQTQPYSLDEVASVIFEISSEADGYVAAVGYDVPVSGSYPEAYATMRRAVANGVIGIVMMTLFPSDPAKGGSAAHANQYAADYQRFRDGLKAGTLLLAGAPKSTDETDGRVLPHGGAIASPRISLHTPF